MKAKLPPDLKLKFGHLIGPWRLCFAWRPVRTYDDKWMWMTRCWRRRYQLHDYLTGGPDRWWIYADIEPFR